MNLYKTTGALFLCTALLFTDRELNKCQAAPQPPAPPMTPVAAPSTFKDDDAYREAVRIAGWRDWAFGAIFIDSDWEEKDVVDTVRHALDAGLSPNAHNQYGDTLLVQAAENQRFSTIRLLLARGADINLPGSDGDTPLHRAILNASTWGKPNWPATNAVEILIQNKADVNRKNKRGFTPLMLGAELGYANIADILLKAHADYRLRSPKGQTALQLALELPMDPTYNVFVTYDQPNPSAEVREQAEAGLKDLIKESQLKYLTTKAGQALRKGRMQVAWLITGAGALE